MANLVAEYPNNLLTPLMKLTLAKRSSTIYARAPTKSEGVDYEITIC